jgi:hypothetical protein
MGKSIGHCKEVQSVEMDTAVANGERYRHGERISTGFVESTLNQVVRKRMLKKQQIQWTQRAAHLLLQIQTRILDGEWEATFHAWYPGF